jgi:hypothetical protein
MNVAKGAFGPDHEVLWDSREAQKIYGRGLQFKIKGRLIWISNLNFANPETRNADMEAHWGAMASRGIRPIWIDTSDDVDAFKYIIRLATVTPDGPGPHPIREIWQMGQKLPKRYCEAILKYFIDNQNVLLELSPRTLRRMIETIGATRTPIEGMTAAEQQITLMSEFVSDKKLRELDPIPYPTIAGGGCWNNVPV